MVPAPVICPDTDKPAEQKVKFQPLHQLALGAEAIEGLQQHRRNQLLWCNRGPPEGRIESRERPRQLPQCRVRYLSDRSQRMITTNTGLQINVAEQRS